MRERMRDLVVVLLQFLLCTAMVEAADEWQVSPYIRYAALGALLLSAYLLLSDRIVIYLRSLGRLYARFREWGMGLSQRVKLALMLHLSVRPGEVGAEAIGWGPSPEGFLRTAPAQAERGHESETDFFEYGGYKLPLMSSEPVDDEPRLDEVDIGVLADPLRLPLELQSFDDLRFAESLAEAPDRSRTSRSLSRFV